jgi:hypothetical protein
MPETVKANAIFPETVMAMAVLNARGSGLGLQVEDVSRLFVDLEERSGTKIREIALRSVPGGFYSEDVESFVGRFLAAGYAKARSPIKFEEPGLRVCRQMIKKALEKNPEGVKGVARALNYDLDRLIRQEAQ